MKSSQPELGTAGSNEALWLRHAAQSNLEQSLNSQWIDVPLAEAALVSSSLITFVIWAVRRICFLRCLPYSNLRLIHSIVRDVRLLPSATLITSSVVCSWRPSVATVLMYHPLSRTTRLPWRLALRQGRKMLLRSVQAYRSIRILTSHPITFLRHGLMRRHGIRPGHLPKCIRRNAVGSAGVHWPLSLAIHPSLQLSTRNPHSSIWRILVTYVFSPFIYWRLFLTSFVCSIFYCSRGRFPIGRRVVIDLRSPRKIQCGHFIVAACYFGTSPRASAAIPWVVIWKRNMPSKSGSRRSPSKTHLTLMFVISTLPFSMCWEYLYKYALFSLVHYHWAVLINFPVHE